MMTSSLQSWPEPIVRVQTLSESGVARIPERYVKPPSERPLPIPKFTPRGRDRTHDSTNIPVINLDSIMSSGDRSTLLLEHISYACREWGFFQVVNHGVSDELMGAAREAWREFFGLPVEAKQEYANNPSTYEGYGSRIGVEREATLDWCDYFFLHYSPRSVRNPSKWPALPLSCRELISEYGKELTELSKRLLSLISRSLGLEGDYLERAFGGREEFGACLRTNFYPKCPQPDLTLGLSAHSDPGFLTILLPDPHVSGLQVRHRDHWVTVKPIPNALIVNLADQMQHIQVVTNAIYRSVEHRVIVNSARERVSLAFFCNPKSDLLIQPAKELVTEDRPALYSPMTYEEYRTYIRTKGLRGKSQVESLVRLPTKN
ncbi:jasmonate-induced oxygenase 4-like isoform X1 [Rhodamnia argentea]|uniref:Jasmonate-induced oxygenase 4-like isoform X1 n=1 Tax=Rhodamnia argentea TaxID=178133 RepID=A0ABM3HR40_9MYRT|nr:jasmonate-induced oxygenase 4-like isoform X1 [Rhodamnia argentea]